MAREQQPSKQPTDIRLRASKPIRRLLPVEKFPIGRRRGSVPEDPPSVIGAVLARVTDDRDPEGESRVQVEITTDAQTDPQRLWARIVAAGAGDSRGISFLPDIGDEVVVVFEEGDPQQPLVLGGLWSSSDPPPDEVGGGRRTIVSRSGIRIEFDDDEVALTVSTPAGNTLRLRDAERDCTIADTNGNTIHLDAAGVTIESTGRIELSASGTLDITAALVNADTSLADFSGVLKCETLIADRVTAASYTPGEGNIF